MDSTSSHRLQVEGSKPPMSATKKQDMIKWFHGTNVTTDGPALKKLQIYEIAKARKDQTNPTYCVDPYLQQQSHGLLRLQPYHCQSSPIELTQGDMKQFVASSVLPFKQKDVRDLISEGL